MRWQDLRRRYADSALSHEAGDGHARADRDAYAGCHRTSDLHAHTYYHLYAQRCSGISVADGHTNAAG